MGGGVIAAAVGLQLMLVVPQLPAGGFGIWTGLKGCPSGTPGAGLPYDDLLGVRPAQGQLIAPEGHLQGVAQRGNFIYLHLGAGGQPHIH